jgi:glutamate/tyrosine decarboxylase-like PLP-dependent enzyme
MDGAYNPGHPGALAHLDPPPLAASIVGDLICAGLNNNLLAEELSPSLSRLERSLMAWLAERLGHAPGQWRCTGERRHPLQPHGPGHRPPRAPARLQR